jgi:hypothetical protein
MSRKMKDKELESFENRFGCKPTAIPVAIDALAEYVNKDNPIKGMRIADVDAVFSSTRKCGADKSIARHAIKLEEEGESPQGYSETRHTSNQVREMATDTLNAFARYDTELAYKMPAWMTSTRTPCVLWLPL